MCFATFLTRPTVWIALAAILWASLAPSLAHALSLSPDGHHIHRISVDYCAGDGSTGDGSLTLDVVHDGPHDASPGSRAGDAHGDNHHCPLCRNPHADVGILPAPVPVVPVPVGRAITYPPLFFLAANSLHAWSAVQPRAPPAN
ncbi:DUF2946 family protein [Achromobacter piechaudii]|uniref:DUF2946 family protein n=1 Tax=Achromobacter piechaudii TaxID=72556 RepID=UPI000587E4C9|nr:DUF2946 family protein [Achromobacter piechaudii]